MIIYLFEAIHLFFRSSAFNEASTLSLFVPTVMSFFVDCVLFISTYCFLLVK